MKHGTNWRLCRDCRFFESGDCMNPNVKPENLVSGARPSAWSVREYPLLYGDACSKEGKTFEPHTVVLHARVVEPLALPNPDAKPVQMNALQRVLCWVNERIKP